MIEKHCTMMLHHKLQKAPNWLEKNRLVLKAKVTEKSEND